MKRSPAPESYLEGARLRRASVPPARRYIRHPPPLPVRSHAARLPARVSNGPRSSPMNSVRCPSASWVDEEVYARALPSVSAHSALCRTRPLRHCMRSAPSAPPRARPFRPRRVTHLAFRRVRAPSCHRPAALSRAALDPLPHAPHASPPTDRALHRLPRIPRGLAATTRYIRPALTGFLQVCILPGAAQPGASSGLKQNVAVQVGVMPANLLCAPSTASPTARPSWSSPCTANPVPPGDSWETWLQLSLWLPSRPSLHVYKYIDFPFVHNAPFEFQSVLQKKRLAGS
ncbi:hypothetical protein C8J57DRAFT_1505528 [Mycena rebaudengoi]|nr:hypothetical protein C8J57DRAFT_1505528 [Mycena rebaudengoi]